MRLITISAIFIIIFSLAVSADVITSTASEYHVTPRLDGMVELIDEDVWTIGLWLGEYDAKNGYPRDPYYAITLTQRMDLQNDLEELYLKLTKEGYQGQYLQAYRMGYTRGQWEIDIDDIVKSDLDPEVQAAVANVGFSSSYDYGYQKGYQDAAAESNYDAIGYYKEIQAAGVKKSHMVRIAYTVKREQNNFFSGYRNGYYSYKAIPVPEDGVDLYDVTLDDPTIEYVRELLPYAIYDPYTIGTATGWSDAKAGNAKRKTYMIDELNAVSVTSIDYNNLYDHLRNERGEYYVGYDDGYELAVS